MRSASPRTARRVSRARKLAPEQHTRSLGELRASTRSHARIQAGIDSAPSDLVLDGTVFSATADRRGYLSWDVDHAGWLVFLHHPEEQTFHGRTLEEALAWCLVWLMAPEIGIGQYLV